MEAARLYQTPSTTVTTSTQSSYFIARLVLRVLLFASTLTAAVLVVTSKQTELILTPFSSTRIPRSAKYNDSDGLVYFVSALWSVVGYSSSSIIYTIMGWYQCSTKWQIYYLFLDLLVFGVLASATGTGGGVAYIGYKGNSSVGWGKVCNIYGKFCKHIGASLGLSLFASVIFVILIMLSIVSTHRPIRS